MAALFSLGQQILTVVEDYYATLGVTLPDRRLVLPGLPAWDCEMVGVQIDRLFRHTGNIAQQDTDPVHFTGGLALPGAVIAVWVIRCVPTPTDTGDPPSVADEEDAALSILSDATHVMAALDHAVATGEIGGCSSALFEDWSYLGPQGGLGGGVTRFRLGFDWWWSGS